MSFDALTKRFLIKISGEALAGASGVGVDHAALDWIGREIAQAAAIAQIAVVVGGGNFMRGNTNQLPLTRVSADYVGMLATVMNSVYLEQWLKAADIDSALFSSLRLHPQIETYSAGAAIKALENGQVAILAGGTGNPYFTTDTTAALRALEINASTLVKATNVDGIYNSDPAKDPAASRYQEIDYDTAIVKDLKVMDGTAFALCRSNNMPIRVVNLNTRGNLQRVVEGDAVGTLVIKSGEQDA